MDGRQPPAAGPSNPLRPIQRRRPASNSNNPLVARKKPRPQQPRPANPASASAPASGPLPAVAKPPGRPKQGVEELRKLYNGWSEPPPPHPYVDYPLFTTPRELRQGIRFHVMRLTALPDKADKTAPQDQPKKIDPTDPNEFTRPVTLHRRDPRQPPIGRTIKEEEKPPVVPMDEGDAERLAQQKAEREVQRALDMAQIAPVAKDLNANKKAAKKNPKADKVNPVFQRPDESFKKEADLHYEESLPWHLEDADGKNVWVGSYIGPLSETNVAFVIQDSNFRMIPLEKFYKFKAKPPFTPFSIEQAEMILNKKAEVGRWAMLDDEKKQREEEALEFRKYLSGGVKVKAESASFKNSSRAEKLDHDELDMSDNEFQDDDEKPSLERDNDEDFVEAQNKIRRNMLGANLFGDGDEHEVERQEEEEAEEELARKIAGDTIRKKLIKQEKETVYATDSDDDPFKSSSEDEAENEADKDKPKEEDSKNGKSSQGGPSTAKSNTGATNKQKLADNAKKGKSLKRPGSPNLSESSSNESSRKKVKKGNSSVHPSRSSTPVPGSQGTRDGDLTSGEMSDSAPARSQPGANRSGPHGGSRAASPASTPASGATQRAGSPSGIIQPADIAAVIPAPPNGISIGNLLQHFQRRVGNGPDQVAKPAFISMVRSVAVFGPDKLLRRRN